MKISEIVNTLESMIEFENDKKNTIKREVPPYITKTGVKVKKTYKNKPFLKELHRQLAYYQVQQRLFGDINVNPPNINKSDTNV